MIVVSDTSPLIALGDIGRLELLRQILGEIHIPEAVYDEIVFVGWEGAAKQAIVDASWIHTVAVKDTLAVDVLLDELDKGEAETIVLARELDADWVCMDEKKGRRKLTRLGLRKIGTLGILLSAKWAGLLPTVRPEIIKLRQKGFNLSDAVIEQALAEAGE